MKQRFVCRGLFIPLLLIVSLLGSCVQDHTDSGRRTEQEPTVTFSIKVPRVATPQATRSLTVDEESGVSTIHVMVFEENGGYKYTRVGKQYGTPTQKGENTQITFEVTLPKGQPFDLVFLANGLNALTNAKDALVEGASKDVVLGAIKESRPAGTKWTEKYIPMWGYKYGITIDENTSLTEGKDGAISMVRMLAKVEVVLSKEAAGVLGNNENFAIEELVLYNYNTAGTLVPKMDLPWDDKDSEPNVPAGSKVPKGEFLLYTSADDPTGLQFKADTVRNTIYTFEAMNGSISSSLENVCLVIGGSYKGGATSYYRVDFVDRKNKDNLLHLKRNHRYNFVITAVTGEGLPSHREAYEAGPVNIEANVLQWNAGDMGDVVFNDQNFLAINPGSIEHDRNEVKGQKVVLKTDYDREEPTFKVSGSLTDPDVALKGDWLKLTTPTSKESIDVGGYPASKYTLSYDADINDDGKTRHAYIYVTVGRLVNVVRVTQSSVVNIGIKFQRENADGDWEDTKSLHFAQAKAGDAPEAQKYRIVWSPGTEKVTLDLTGARAGNHELVWEEGAGLDKPAGGEITDATGKGEKVFYVKPKSIAAYERGTFIGANASLSALVKTGGDLAATTLSIEQFVKDVWIEQSVQIMDGKPNHSVNVKSNVPWNLYVNKNKSFGSGTSTYVVTELNGREVFELGNDDDDFFQKVGKAYVENGVFNLPNGTDVPMTPVNDITVKPKPHIYTGHLGLYAESIEDATLNDGKGILCASGIPQDGREANCYVLNPESGVGLLIPVKAANGVMVDKYNKFHNGGKLYNGGVTITEKIGDSNPKYGAKLVWADDFGTDKDNNKVGLADDGLLSLVIPAGEGKDGYILVMPGSAQKEGNAVVAVTRTDAENDAHKGEILWSWHIWITKGMKYEQKDGEGDMQTRVLGGFNGTELDETGTKDGSLWLDRNLGALNNGGAGKTNADTYGVHYQWGRKDPFPGSNKLKISTVGQANERQLYHSTGLITMNGAHGSVKYVTSGTTVPNSIKAPDTYNYNSSNNDWLSSHIHTLWGVAYEGTTTTTAGGEGTNYGKSIFDPCPAGYRVPRREAKTWNLGSNTLHWGREYENLDATMGKPTANIATNYGIQWPSSVPYKGGWYPTAGNRYTGGLNTSVGSYGNYWSSSAVSAYGRSLYFYSGLVYPSTHGNRYYGFAMRCVAE